MNTITASQINKKIKSLSPDLLQEVDKYIDFLNYKSSQTDWSGQLSEQDIFFVEKGKADIQEGRVFSHKEAKQKIKDYIKNKSV